MAYMKKVTNAATDPGYGAGWFKIQEAGLSACEWYCCRYALWNADISSWEMGRG